MNVKLISFYNRFKEYSTKYSLGTLKLAAYIGQDKDFDVQIVPINSEEELTEEKVAELCDGNPAILGIPNFMWTENLAKKISAEVAKKSPETLRVVGGPSTNTVDFADWNSDEIFVIGEGEEALMEICKAKRENPHFDSTQIRNLKAKNMFSTTSDLEDRHVLYTNTQIPRGMPLFSEKIEDMKVDKTPEDFAWYETTRGCAYNCGYCGHKTRNNLGDVDLDIIEEEIKNIGDRGIKRLFIVDPIIGGKKDKGKEVLKLCNRDIPDTKLIAYLRPEMLDSEFVEILENCNLEEMRFGIQTLNPNVPGWVRSNSIGKIKTELSKLRGKDINWRAELITGLPGDDMNGLRNSIQGVIEDFQPTVLAAYHLTAIKGTKLYNLVDGTDPEKWLRVNEDSQAIESYSYTEDDFREMARYSNGMTGLYNLLKKMYPKKTVGFDKLEKFVTTYIGDADEEKIMDFDDEYMEEFWKSKLKEITHEKVNSNETWSIPRKQNEGYSRDDD